MAINDSLSALSWQIRDVMTFPESSRNFHDASINIAYNWNC